MFFYLINNSRLFNKSVKEAEKLKKLLIYGTISYILLHAVLFVGGKSALFYNFRHYFWIILGLDVIVLLVNDIENGDSMLGKLFNNQDSDIKSEYRVDIQNATINDIMAGQELEKEPEPEPEPDTTNQISNTSEMPLRKREKKKKSKKVGFDLTGSNNNGNVNTDFNKFSQPIINPNHITRESVLSKPSPKSTPLDSLFRERSMNPNDFMPNDADNDGYQSFSDSESEYSSDLDMDSFEKGLTM